MRKETGGPAFPHEAHGPNLSTWTETGMTLRDYFAAKAMQVYIVPLGLHGAVKMAYETADAMLAERNK